MLSPAGYLLPYQSIESMARTFGVDEEIVWKWLNELGGSRNYAYYFLHYRRWFMEKEYWRNAQEMIDEYNHLDELGRAKHVEHLEEYVKSKKTGSNDRKQVWHAVKHFYSNSIVSTVPTIPTLPRTKAGKLFALSELDKSRNAQKVKLTDENISDLITAAKMPYQAIFMILSQSGMGLAEYEQFNKTVWRTVIDKLDSTQPVQLLLYRSKTSRDKRQDYYTFLSRDSLYLLKVWLKERDALNVNDEHCFLVKLKRKNATRWVPATSRMVGEQLTETASRARLIVKGPNGVANRYALHCHEFRDRLRSLCELRGVAKAPSEFFLGHDVDKLHYDKSPWYDIEHYRSQYRKVEHAVNVISNPPGAMGKDEVAAMINRQQLRMFGYTDAELQTVDLAKLTPEQVREMGQKKQKEPQAVERTVRVPELQKWLKKGAEYVDKVGKNTVVIRLPAS